MSDGEKYFGKYRGVVTNNIDPELSGRLQIQVPDVTGSNISTWALPCVPYAGSGVGLFLVPPVNALVWVEYEQGDPDYPIWTGCYWGLGEAPAVPAIAGMKVLKTDSGTITINDLPGIGGITIETATGMKIALSLQGIEINNGMGATIKLQGPMVSINGSALEVM